MTFQESNNEIVKYLAEGLRVKEIAEKLNMKQRTVTDRIASLKKLYDCTNIAQLVYKASEATKV